MADLVSTASGSKSSVRAAIGKAIRETLDSDELLEEVADIVLSRWHTAYLAKAFGGQDEFGNEWPPLKETTVKAKQRKNQRPVIRDRDRRDRHARLLTQLMQAGLTRQEAQTKANALVWQTSPQTAGGVPINIDQGPLQDSLHPDGGDMQVREIDGSRITLGTEVPHAGHVNRRRRFLPTSDEAATWTGDAAIAVRDIVAARVLKEVA